LVAPPRSHHNGGGTFGRPVCRNAALQGSFLGAPGDRSRAWAASARAGSGRNALEGSSEYPRVRGCVYCAWDLSVVWPMRADEARESEGAAAMQQVADWLEKLGLGQYVQCFAQNDIDVSVRPHLTDADLEQIGVSLGHRRKILAAIADLGGRAQPTPQPVRSEPRPQQTAEQRQVTVLFSSGLRHFRPASTPRTSGRSFRRIRNAQPRWSSASAGS
jgi:hypothetical protein